VPGAAPRDPKLRPIEVAISSTEHRRHHRQLPDRGAAARWHAADRRDATFSNDIPAVTGRTVVVKTGVVPMAVDPSKSYIERVRVRGDAPERALAHHLPGRWLPASRPGPQPVSVVLGHSHRLPAREAHGRAPGRPAGGLLHVEYTAFEPHRRGTGQAGADRPLPAGKGQPGGRRQRPGQAHHLLPGPGIPERWKPYITAGVLQWLPVFEAAGFSNAIRVLDAPTPEQDPTGRPRT
jgi:hypothetical protein